jgi:hypothetical protein
MITDTKYVDDVCLTDGRGEYSDTSSVGFLYDNVTTDISYYHDVSGRRHFGMSYAACRSDHMKVVTMWLEEGAAHLMSSRPTVKNETTTLERIPA